MPVCLHKSPGLSYDTSPEFSEFSQAQVFSLGKTPTLEVKLRGNVSRTEKVWGEIEEFGQSPIPTPIPCLFVKNLRLPSPQMKSQLKLPSLCSGILHPESAPGVPGLLECGSFFSLLPMMPQGGGTSRKSRQFGYFGGLKTTLSVPELPWDMSCHALGALQVRG